MHGETQHHKHAPQWTDKGTYKEPTGSDNVRAPRFEVDDATTYLDKDGSDNLTLTDAITGTKTLAELSAGGAGDVTGPASSVDNAIVRFHETTGKVIQDYTSGAPTISDTGVFSGFTLGGDIIGQATYDIGSAASPFAEAYLGNATDYLKIATVSNISTLYGVGSYVRIGDAGGAAYFAANEDNFLVSGHAEVVGTLYAAGTLEVHNADATDYITLTVVSNVPTLYGTGAYLRIGDAGTTSHSLASEDDLMVTGTLEVDGTAYIDSDLYIGNNTFVFDDKYFSFGNQVDAKLIYETADADALALVLGLPHVDENANNVPVFVLGDIDVVNVNLGFFDGITEPRLAVVDVDRDSWVALGFNADDDARVMIGGNSTLTMPAFDASGDITLAAAKSIEYTTPTANHTASGIIVTKTAGTALVFGDACYTGTDGKMEKALADDAAITIPATHLCIATIAENATGLFLEQGEADDDSWAFDVGLSVYLSKDTAGLIVKTMPTKVTGNQVQVLGTCVEDTTKIYWNPSPVVVEYA